MNWADVAGILSLPPVQRGVAGLLISGIGLPIVGVFIVGLDIFPVRFAVMHVALLGVALGLIFGLDPLACALALCALMGVILAPLATRPGGLAGGVGFLMTITIALAFLALSISGVNATGAFELLWGSILATRAQEIGLLACLSAVLVALYQWKRRDLALLLFDREIALCSGVRVNRLTMLLLILISVSIGAAIRITGALLVDAVTLLPALAARNVGKSFRSITLLAILFGLLGNTTGFTVALIVDQPIGPILVLTAGAITVLTYMVNALRDVTP